MGRATRAAVFLFAACGAAGAEDSLAALERSLARVVEMMSSNEVVWPRAAPPRSPGVASPKDSAERVLIEMAQSEDPLTRLHGLEGLAQAGRIEHVDVFLEALADPDAKVRELAEKALLAYAPDAVFERIMGVVCRGDMDHAFAVGRALPVLRTAMEPKMLAVLDSAEESVDRKQAAAYCLGQMGSVSAVGPLAGCAWSSDERLALSAVNALVALRDPVTAPQLAELIRHPMVEVRYVAMGALADIGGPKAIEMLGQIAATSENGERVCKQAVFLLASLKGEGVVPALIDVMRKNLSMRRSAAGALCRITGVDLGDLPSDWAEWYQAKQREPRMPEQDTFVPPLFEVEALRN